MKRRIDWSAGAVLTLAVAAGTAGAETRTTEMALGLRDAVARALEGNPGLVDARMDRMLQRYDVEEAEEHFKPQWSLGTGTVDYGYSQANDERDVRVSAGPGVEMRLATGGRVEAGPRWERTIEGPQSGEESAGLVVRITQPLARGAGWEVANAPVAQSALTERENVLRLRGAVMDVVTEVVTAYRAVMQAALQTDIERRSLAQALASRKVVEALIATGRIARSDLTQSDADVAEREIGVVRSEAANDEAQAKLAVLLGLDAGVRVRTTESLRASPSPVDERTSLDRALVTHTGYRSAEIAVRRAEIARHLADDGTRWDVSLDAQASFAGAGVGDLAGRLDSHGDYRVTLNLRIPFGGSEGTGRGAGEAGRPDRPHEGGAGARDRPAGARDRGPRGGRGGAEPGAAHAARGRGAGACEEDGRDRGGEAAPGAHVELPDGADPHRSRERRHG